MREYEYPRELEERLKRQSLSGSNGERRRKTIKIDLDKFKKFFITYTLVIAMATSAIIGGGSHVIHNIQDSMYVNGLIMDFHRDCIAHETHRTQDNEHYYYDYDDIARYIEESGEIDIGLYLFNRNTNDYQTGRVLHYMDYGSMEEYLSAHGWEDADEWRNDIRERIILQSEIDERNEELAKMTEEHKDNSSQDDNYLGGAK